VPDDVPLPLVLAGGLNAQNVAQAIDTVHPYAVDVSGGVETQKGIKDPEKMSAFLKEVYRVG
jgi:phosphoribosylanthranilate isomerase